MNKGDENEGREKFWHLVHRGYFNYQVSQGTNLQMILPPYKYYYDTYNVDTTQVAFCAHDKDGNLLWFVMHIPAVGLVIFGETEL